MTLTLAHTKEAIKRLGKELNLPIDKADVMKVEIAENFEMDNPPELYISKMKSLGTSHPNKWGSGTTYFPMKRVAYFGFMIRAGNFGRGASIAISEKAALCQRGKRKIY